MNKIRQLVLFGAGLTMSIAAAVAADSAEALNLHLADGKVQSTRLENFKRIRFADNNLLLQTTNGNETSVSLGNFAKITFGDYIAPSGIFGLSADPDISVYATPQGDVVVETSFDLLCVKTFDLNGKILFTTVEKQLNISSLPSGVYLFQINTAQGSVTKKIIK